MEHTPEENQTIGEYENATDQDILDFVNNVNSEQERLNYVTVAFLSPQAAARIRELTGKSVDGNRVVLDVSAVRHIKNRHGADGKQDHSMQNADDIARMGYVIMNYDDITYDGKTTSGYQDENGDPAPLVRFSKRIDGTYYVIETVSAAKSKRNYVVTAFISRA